MKVRYFEKRPGAWHLDFKAPDGRRCRPYGGTTEAEAQRRAPIVIAEAVKPSEEAKAPKAAALVKPSLIVNGPTLDDAFKLAMKVRERWMRAKSKLTLEQTFAQLGDPHQPLASFTRDRVRELRTEWMQERGKREGTTLSASTVNHRLSMLSVLLDVCDLEPHNVKHLSTKGNRRKRRAREEELQAVIAWCVANHHRKGALLLADMVTVGLATVARKGELMNLEDRDLYIELGQVTFRDTKNGESRTVPLNEGAKRVLERRMGRPEGGPFKGVNKTQLGALWRDARKAMGLEDDEEFVFHVATRHEGASRLGDQGASAFQLKAMMGNTIQAADVYVKPEVESLRALAEGINRQPQGENA